MHVASWPYGTRTRTLDGTRCSCLWSRCRAAQCVDVVGNGSCLLYGRAGPGSVLRRIGSQKECVEHHDALHILDGHHDRRMGLGGILVGIRRAAQIGRQFRLRHDARRGSCLGRSVIAAANADGQRAFAPSHAHVVSVHVLRAHSRHHVGGFCRTHEVQCVGMVFGVMGSVGLLPLAHWVWGGGILAYGTGWLGGALDFAGGTVVHISSGTAALVAALMIGPRLGYRQEPMPPHNLTYSTLGTAFLWMGWFGFNSGNALEINGIATSAIMATQFSAAAGAVVWAGCEWWQRAKPSVLGACSGAVAGLVGISPAAGHVGPMSALIMGAVAGVGCYVACYRLKRSFGYDDALDAFGLHGIGGFIGALLTGIFATRAVWNMAEGQPLGVIEGNWHTLLGQLAGCVVACGYVAFMTFVLLKLLDVTLGLRVNSTMERQGLDVTQHGEEGYIFL